MSEMTKELDEDETVNSLLAGKPFRERKLQTRAMSGVDTYRIRLAAIGAPALNIPIHFADDASKVFCAYREKYQFGASEMEGGCGNIYNSQGALVGTISYNGRIWDAEGKPVE